MTRYEKGLQLILPMLSPFEQDVLTMLHGLDGNSPQTRKVVSEKLNISMESIIEIYSNAAFLVIRTVLQKHDAIDFSADKKKLEKYFTPNQEDINDILSSFTTYEKKVIKAKYGLESKHELSDEELLEKFSNTNLSQKNLDSQIKRIKRRIEHKPDESLNDTI